MTPQRTAKLWNFKSFSKNVQKIEKDIKSNITTTAIERESHENYS